MSKKDCVLITLHGIRTHGKWQESFKKVLDEHSSNFVHYSMNYGFLSFLSVFFPFSRNLIVEKALKEIGEMIEKNSEKEIHIIAHSFGTYIIIQFLMRKKLPKKIKTLILAASVLPKNFLKKIDLSNNVDRFINDCGDKDYRLFFNTILSVKFGDSGRVGFVVSNNSQVCNRYFKGSHKLYFNDNFYKKYWLPYILGNSEIKPLDKRTAKIR